MGVDPFHLLVQLSDLRANEHVVAQEVPSIEIDVRSDPRLGICACSVAAAQNFKGMMVVRFAIGLAEAGFYPAILYHM